MVRFFGLITLPSENQHTIHSLPIQCVLNMVIFNHTYTTLGLKYQISPTPGFHAYKKPVSYSAPGNPRELTPLNSFLSALVVPYSSSLTNPPSML